MTGIYLIDYLRLYETFEGEALDDVTDKVVHIFHTNANLRSMTDRISSVQRATECALFSKIEVTGLLPGGAPLCSFSRFITLNLDRINSFVRNNWEKEFWEDLDYNNIRDVFLGEIDRITRGDIPEGMLRSYLDLFRSCEPCVLTGGRHETEV